MATFVVLWNWTDQGIRNVKDTTRRADAFRTALEKAGGTLKSFHWTMGRYDGVAIIDMPDAETTTAVALSLCSLGNVRTQTLRAYSADEMSRIVGKIP